MKNCFVQKQTKRTFVNFGNDDAGKGAHSDIKKRDFSFILDSAHRYKMPPIQDVSIWAIFFWFRHNTLCNRALL